MKILTFCLFALNSGATKEFMHVNLVHLLKGDFVSSKSITEMNNGVSDFLLSMQREPVISSLLEILSRTEDLAIELDNSHLPINPATVDYIIPFSAIAVDYIFSYQASSCERWVSALSGVFMFKETSTETINIGRYENESEVPVILKTLRQTIMEESVKRVGRNPIELKEFLAYLGLEEATIKAAKNFILTRKYPLPIIKKEIAEAVEKEDFETVMEKAGQGKEIVETSKQLSFLDKYSKRTDYDFTLQETCYYVAKYAKDNKLDNAMLFFLGLAELV